MQNLQLPVIPIQETFYLRQLTVNVFGINNLGKNKARFYTYHEGLAKKGPNEVVSFIEDYITNEIPTGVKHLHIFSDSCGGQNRNHTVIRFFMQLVQSHRFESINQYFPQRGHSFLPNDRNFAAIKRVIRRHDRIYTPMEYTEMIVHSTRQSEFSVKMVDSREIKDFKSWWPRFYKKQCLSIESLGRAVPRNQKQSFQISSFCHFVYLSSNPGILKAMECIDDGFISHHFRLSVTNNVVPGAKDLAYPAGKVPINHKKISNIRDLAKYVPEEKQTFYEEILNWPVTEEDDHD